MKTLKNIGLIVFVTGMVLFTVNIFLPRYEITGENVTAHFDATPNKNDKGDTIAIIFNAAVDEYFSKNEKPDDYNIFSFNTEIEGIINLHNEKVKEKFLPIEGITEAEQQRILELAKNGDNVEYSEETIKEGLNNDANKVEKVKNGTNWMYTSQRSFGSFDEFKSAFEGKIGEINGSVGKAYQVGTDGGTLFGINKSFLTSGAKSNTWLWFFLTFGLVAIGSLLYNLPKIKLFGPAGIKNDHVYHEAISSRGWIAWIVLLWLVGFYVILYFYPQYLANAIELVDPISNALSGNDASQWFLYGFIYSFAMTVMAIRMYIKYRGNAYQIVRTTVVLFFQIAFAFIIPEILIRLNQPYFDFKNAWPLNYDFLTEFKIQELLENGTFGIFMLVWGIILSAIIVPVMVYFFGKRWYCSWVCGCGGLAETLGDPFRQLSDKRLWAWKLERWLIHGVLVFVVIMTGLSLYSFFTVGL